MDFESYKNLRNTRRENGGEGVTEQEIGAVIADLKKQIVQKTSEMSALIEEGAEAGAMRRLAGLTNCEHGNADATAPAVSFHELSQAQRRLQKLVYWQKKLALGLGSDKTLPGYHNPYDFDDEDEGTTTYHFGNNGNWYAHQMASDIAAEQKMESEAFKSTLADDMAATPAPTKIKSEVCHNCGFASDINPCKFCGNLIS